MPRARGAARPARGRRRLWLPAQMTAAERDERHQPQLHGPRAAGRRHDARAGVRGARGVRRAHDRGTSGIPSRRSACGWCRSPSRRSSPSGRRCSSSPAASRCCCSWRAPTRRRCSSRARRTAARSWRCAPRSARPGRGCCRWRSPSAWCSAVLGGLAGLVLGSWALRALLPLFAGSLPPSVAVDVDARVALFTAAMHGRLGLVFGVVVAAQRPARSLGDALKTAPAEPRRRPRDARRTALVVAQVALAVVLLSAAGLMLTASCKLSRVGPGFDAEHVLTFKARADADRTTRRPRRASRSRRTCWRACSATPGVRERGADLDASRSAARAAPTASRSRAVPRTPANDP